MASVNNSDIRKSFPGKMSKLLNSAQNQTPLSIDDASFLAFAANYDILGPYNTNSELLDRMTAHLKEHNDTVKRAMNYNDPEGRRADTLLAEMAENNPREFIATALTCGLDHLKENRRKKDIEYDKDNMFFGFTDSDTLQIDNTFRGVAINHQRFIEKPPTKLGRFFQQTIPIVTGSAPPWQEAMYDVMQEAKKRPYMQQTMQNTNNPIPPSPYQ